MCQNCGKLLHNSQDKHCFFICNTLFYDHVKLKCNDTGMMNDDCFSVTTLIPPLPSCATQVSKPPSCCRGSLSHRTVAPSRLAFTAFSISTILRHCTPCIVIHGVSRFHRVYGVRADCFISGRDSEDCACPSSPRSAKGDLSADVDTSCLKCRVSSSRIVSGLVVS